MDSGSRIALRGRDNLRADTVVPVDAPGNVVVRLAGEASDAVSATEFVEQVVRDALGEIERRATGRVPPSEDERRERGHVLAQAPDAHLDGDRRQSFDNEAWTSRGPAIVTPG
ncbi:MAG: hypothetical protein ABEI98_07265 [Halorhabdus sp.]